MARWSACCGARLALDLAADVEEVAGRQRELLGERAPDLRAAEPRSRPVTLASTAMRRLPASRWIVPSPNVCSIVASLPSGMRLPSWPSISSVESVVGVAAEVGREPHDEVEAPLADPHLGDLLAGEADPDGVDHVAGREADARGRIAVDLDRSCGRPVSGSARRSAMPAMPRMIAAARSPRVPRACRDPGRRCARRCRPACRRGPRRCACRAAS